MKKIYLALTLFVGVVFTTKAQTQRFQIIEEFTGENCGPCASTNPGFDAAWNIPSNESKVTVIKYQGDIPSAGPVLYQQTKTDVDARMGYYAISSHPDMVQDGKFNAGHPGDFLQQWVDDRYTVTSPFQFNLTHSFDATYSNIIITGSITATQAVTYSANQLKQHIIIIEKHIEFDTPPGSNGETEFAHVVRKMLPNASGTALPSVWTAGQTVSINIVAPIPSFIYKLNEVAVVGFIQNNSGKEIQQGVITQPVQPTVDVAVGAIKSLNLYNCGSTIAPKVQVENIGTVGLTSLDLNYKINNDQTSVYSWVGNIAAGATADIQLPSIMVNSTGALTFTCIISSPNGTIDPSSNNNTVSKVFVKSGANGVTSSVSENFSTTTFPPTNWFVDNPGGLTWERRSNGAPAPSARLAFYSIPPGDVDEMYLPSINLDGVQGTLVMSFSVAYVKYDASSTDALQVKASTDCGATWQTLYNKSGSTLATVATPSTTNFAPSSGQFRTETINMSSYVGTTQLLVKFVGISDYGNNVFVDNVNIVGFVPPVISNNNIQFCENSVIPADTLDKLVTVPASHTKNWYTDATGGVASTTAPVIANTPTSVTTYYVSSTNGISESGRLPIVVSVLVGAPSTPSVAVSTVQYCNNAVASSLMPSGNNYVWYTDPVTTDGMASTITPNTSAAGTTTYYLAEKNACGESSRASVDVTVDAPVSVPTTSPVSYCQYASSVALTATGSGLKWYKASTGGVASSASYTPSTAVAGSTTYYVSQTVSGCESPRASLIVSVTAASIAPTASGAAYCSGETPATLTATGTNLKWYTSSTSTVGSSTAPTPSTVSQGISNYYVTQNTNGCESAKSAVSVVVKPTPNAPSLTDKLICYGSEDYTPIVTEANVVWFTSASATTGTTTPPTIIAAPIRTETYYVSITAEGCESERKTITYSVDDCTGIEEINANNTIVVYPNPAKEEILVNYTSDKNQVANVFLTNILGEKVSVNKNLNLVEGENKIDLKLVDVSNGVYFVNIQTEKQLSVIKFIVNR
ncbi:MAG: T9SS type A sorting domain-containing protein [Bacteroidota bacterium]